MRTFSATIAAALCAMLLVSAAVEAQYTPAQAKQLANTIVKGCGDIKSRTCVAYLKVAGGFCQSPKNVAFCTSILRETCLASPKDCLRLQGPFCAQTGTQQKMCLEQAKQFLAIKPAKSSG